HEVVDKATVYSAEKEYLLNTHTKFNYTFENFFHPYVGELIEQLNTRSLAGLFDAKQHRDWRKVFFDKFYSNPSPQLVAIKSSPKEIDVEPSGPYANYNWELLYHFPLAIGVHLSKNQRFAEAQRWFHYIFDPTATDKQYWRFLKFREFMRVTPID